MATSILEDGAAADAISLFPITDLPVRYAFVSGLFVLAHSLVGELKNQIDRHEAGSRLDEVAGLSVEGEQ